MSERDDMDLPAGKVCLDCLHIRRCFAFGFARPGNTRCDFSPSRFREEPRAAPPRATEGGE